MKIGINASFLRKPDTGGGQITYGFINELLNSHSKNNEYYIYLENDISLKLPKNFHKRIVLPKLWKRDDLVRKIWWEKFLLPRVVKKDGCKMFISLYQCPTIFSSQIRHKMLVHDLIPKIFPEYLDNWRKKLYFFLSERAICRANEIITISEWSKKDIQKYLKIPAEKIKVAHQSVDKSFFADSATDKDNEVLEKYNVFGRFIFYIGGLDFRKNLPALFAAFKIISEKAEHKNLKLVIGGEDKSRYSHLFTNIQKELKALDLIDKVVSTGFIDQGDLVSFYRQCELFVFPSLYEGFGLSPLEAMASGAPVAVSKSSSLPEVCGNAALYFNPYDIEEIAKVIGKILENPKLKQGLSEKGKERVKNFSWKKFVETILG